MITTLSHYLRIKIIYCVSPELNIQLNSLDSQSGKGSFDFGNERSPTYPNNQQFALFAAENYWFVVYPSNLQKSETWRIQAIPQFRKTCGYASLRNAFPRDRTCGNVAYTSVSRNGYLSFRRRKPKFPLGNRCINGPGNS